MATPDYSKIWGANSPLAKYEFTEADYLRGWEFIGSIPPARTMFDAWMRKADEKMRWLYDNAFSENSLGGFLFWRLPDTAYFVGEKRALQDGPLDVYIECTIAGRTSKEQMKKLPQGAEIGKTFVDGTATWLVRQFTTSAALDDHRKKTPLDHPDGSVLKRHLGFTVYDKAETDARLNTKAPLASPALTGTPTAPTAGRGTNNAQVATTAFVTQAIAALINGAPGALDTLQELAKALGNDANFAATVTNALAGKVAKSGDEMSGTLTAPQFSLTNNGYLEKGNRDTGDAITNNQGANINIASWYGIGFYDSFGKKYTGSMDLRAGNWETMGYIKARKGFAGDLQGNADSATLLKGTRSLSNDVTTENNEHKWLLVLSSDNKVQHADRTKINVRSADNASTLQGKDVNHFYRHLGGRETPTLIPLVDWEKMKQLNGGNDVRNIRNGGTGIVAYGGDNDFSGGYPRGSIFLKQSYKNFDKILVLCSDDSSDFCYYNLMDRWELELLFANLYRFNIASSTDNYWCVRGNKRGTITAAQSPLSTETIWMGYEQNSSVVEIYGIKY